MFEVKLIKEFRENLRHFERELDIQNSSNCCCGVTLTQCHTLMQLDKKDDVTLNNLAEKLFLDKSTLSRTIEGLVNLGLVKREIPKNNRRTVRIKLTKQGKTVCHKINKDNDEYFHTILDSLPENERINFLKSFQSVVTKMIEVNNHKITCK